MINNFTETIMIKHYDEIYKFVRYSTKNIHNVDDVVQEVFIEAYKKQDQLQSHPFILGWLYRTAKFKMLECFNKEKAILCNQVEFRDEYIDNNTYDLTIEEYSEISEVLNKDELQMLIDKHEIGFKIDEIASKNEISNCATKTRLSRIYKKIKKFFIIVVTFTVKFIIYKWGGY